MTADLGLLAGAFVAGLVGSPHCVGMCGPFALACSTPAGPAVLWHVGRLGTYAALGALAGGFGSALPGPTWLAAAVSAAFVVWFAAVLAGVLPEPRWTPPFLKRVAMGAAEEQGRGSRLAFGLANGLLPCGLVYAALGLAVAASSPWTGALVMLAFGLGTVPALAALTYGVRRFTSGDRRVRRVLALLVLVSGLASIAFRMHAMG